MDRTNIIALTFLITIFGTLGYFNWVTHKYKRINQMPEGLLKKIAYIIGYAWLIICMITLLWATWNVYIPMGFKIYTRLVPHRTFHDDCVKVESKKIIDLTTLDKKELKACEAAEGLE